MAESRLCSIPDCGKSLYVRGFCQNHYGRFRRYGDPLAGRTSHGEPQEFYKNSVLTYEGDECLIWPYSTHRNGYGQMRVGGQLKTVSRLLCEEANGPPPSPDHSAAHSCGNGMKGCVSKRHLLWKTRAENEADKIIHGTHNRGERHPLSKLSDAEALEIYRLKGCESPSVTAARYGIARRTVAEIQNGDRWSWLTG